MAAKNRLILGVDEAGRGPAIGPMVLAAVGVGGRRSSLFDLPLKDSKKLTRKAREVLFFPIVQEADLVVLHVVPAADIDAASLTSLWMGFLLDLAEAQRPRAIYADAPVSKTALHATTRSLEFLLSKRIRRRCRLVLAHKADETYPLVSAASIVAKVARDSLIRSLQAEYGDFGSGYPADPKTRAYLRRTKKLPEVVRKRWKTVERVREEGGGKG